MEIGRKNRSDLGARFRALAAGASIATGTCCYADWIRVNNPAGPTHFDWTTGAASLDVLLQPVAQIGAGGASSLTQIILPTVTNLDGPVRTEVGGAYGLFVLDVPAGTLIPSGAPFSNGLQAYAYYQGFGSEIAENTQTYLGIRFDIGNGAQYGWVGVTRSGAVLDAFAWGYSDRPGEPIPAGAPEPGSLAMLALGATALLVRRRS